MTTRVGQAADLVEHGENGYIADVDDAEAVAEWTAHVAEAPVEETAALTAVARATAEACSYPALAPRWRTLLDGFVELRGR